MVFRRRKDTGRVFNTDNNGSNNVRSQSSIEEPTGIKIEPMGSFEDAFTKSFDEAKTREDSIGEREIIELEFGNRIYKDTGEPISGSLEGRGTFQKLKNDQWVFVPIDLPFKQQKASIDIANEDIDNNDRFDISEVYLVNPRSIPDKIKQSPERINEVDGKTVKKIIKNTRKRFGTIPSYNVAKVIIPLS